MKQFDIGVIVESFRTDFDTALTRAAELGVKGLQMYCTKGEHAPENFSAAERRRVLSAVRERGMCFSALCGDLGQGFGNPDLNPSLIEKSKRILDLALELDTRIVTTHIGVVPTDPHHPRYAIMQVACRELAEYADSIGAHFAVETGPERAEVLCSFLDSLESKGVGVNFDPANLVMVTGDDPVQAVYTLRDYIVHTHAKDGIKLADCNPDYIYRVTPMPEECARIQYFREVPLGTGSVPFPSYLKALENIGYSGFLTVEREVGDTPDRDIGIACEYLRGLMN